ncbi:MAG: T9SS type A sorting domain-containing protein, partial [Flavobacteriales bacterium]
CGPTFGSNYNDVCLSADSTHSNGYIFIGSTESWGQGFNDMMMLKLDTFCASFPSNATEYNDPLVIEHRIENTGLTMNVYPNPTQGVSTIHLPQKASGKLFISNELGDIMWQIIFTDSKDIAVNLMHFSAGFYSITISTREHQYHGKLILN